jgi:hypothetical protein
MFRQLLAIKRRHNQHYKGIILHMLLSVGFYYSIIEGLLVDTEIKNE